jgi:hypothetical protein
MRKRKAVASEKATRREGAWEASFAAVEVHAMIVEPGCSSNRRGASVGGGRKRERSRATQKKKLAIWRRGALGMVSRPENTCRSRGTPRWQGLEMGADGSRGDQAIFWMRALHRLALMMGSGEDTTDKFRRDGWCSLPGARHSKFQHAPCANRRPRLRQISVERAAASLFM